MQRLIMPLVENLVSSYNGLDLSRTKIIGVQHILETTHAMFQSLYQVGLKPKNVSIVGKCYSTCMDVYREMLDDGIDVDKGSFVYSSHVPYDEQFNDIIEGFVSERINDILSGNFDKIIIIDDGGKLIDVLNKYPSLPTMVAIEQTTAGYEAIRRISLKFPVINVARSPVKLKIESPMIATAAVDRLCLSLEKRDLFPEKALIIGCGAIGSAVKKRLLENMKISVYDKNRPICKDLKLADMIPSFSLIIGCTGTTSIPFQLHSLFASNTTLVSVSSSDREFDAVHLRKNLPEINVCHKDLLIKDILLVNSGFPVNFDGDRENVDPEFIQLTMGLLTAGILQARESALEKQIIPFDSNKEQMIEKDYSLLGKSNSN